MTRSTKSDKANKTNNKINIVPSHNPNKRLPAIILLVVFLFCAVFVKLIFVMLVDGKALQVKALEQWMRDVPTEAPRGQILDRNGEVLASTATRYNVYVRPNAVKNMEGVISLLSSALGCDAERLRNKLNKSASEITVATGVTKEQLNAVYSGGQTGIYYAEDNFRYYPYGDFMTQVLGFTGFDGNGQTGLEAYYDEYLSGTNGKILTETDLVGRELEGGQSYYLPSVNGMNLMTTLDVTIQKIVDAAVSQAVTVYKPKSVACVVMNYETGEIAALSEYPSFDLNDVPRDNLELLFGSSKSTLISTVYEPGSTFKILTAAAALNSGVTDVSHRYYCAGSRVVDGKKIRCWKTKGHGSIDFAEGVEQSCNCVFMDSALSLGTAEFYQYLRAFGLTARTGVDMTGETSGILIKEDAVKTVDLARIGFGQAIAVTPIGMLRAASAVINGGTLVTPHLLSGIQDCYGGKTVQNTFEISDNRVISESTASIMRELLTRVVTNGSGKGAAVNGFDVAGKTGTAQKYKDGAIAQGKYISSFIGFSLVEGAKYGVAFIVDEPQGYVYYGSLVAAPLVGDVFEGIFNYLGLEPRENAEDIESTFDPTDLEFYCDLSLP